MVNDFTVENIVVCDDARRENTGKDILIGVYSNIMNTPVLPATVSLCFWLEILAKKSGPLSIQLKLETPDQPTAMQLSVETLVIDSSSSFSIATPHIVHMISQLGNIKLFVRPLGTEKWRLIKRVKLAYLPSPPNSGPPPPT